MKIVPNKQQTWHRVGALFSPAVLAGVAAVIFFVLLVGTGAVQGASPLMNKNIVLVHGAFADGSSWAKVAMILQAKGYHVTAVQIPLTSLAAKTKRPSHCEGLT